MLQASCLPVSCRGHLCCYDGHSWECLLKPAVLQPETSCFAVVPPLGMRVMCDMSFERCQAARLPGGLAALIVTVVSCCFHAMRFCLLSKALQQSATSPSTWPCKPRLCGMTGECVWPSRHNTASTLAGTIMCDVRRSSLADMHTCRLWLQLCCSPEEPLHCICVLACLGELSCVSPLFAVVTCCYVRFLLVHKHWLHACTQLDMQPCSSRPSCPMTGTLGKSRLHLQF